MWDEQPVSDGKFWALLHPENGEIGGFFKAKKTGTCYASIGFNGVSFMRTGKSRPKVLQEFEDEVIRRAPKLFGSDVTFVLETKP